MRTSQGVALAGGLSALCLASGCVSLAEYDHVRVSNKALQAEKDQLETELYDARNVAETMRARIASMEGELGTKDQFVSNLTQENNRLHDAFRSAQGALEQAANSPAPTTLVLESAKLPQELDSALKRFADQYPGVVTYDPKRGSVKWNADLVFALGSDLVQPSAMSALKSFTDVLRSSAAADFEVVIVGHTDDRPIKRESTAAAHPTNWHLSAHRAIAVSNVLQKDGFEPHRIGVMGYGEYRPTVSNASEDGRSKNRRVEIYLVPRGSLVESSMASGSTTTGRGLAQTGQP